MKKNYKLALQDKSSCLPPSAKVLQKILIIFLSFTATHLGAQCTDCTSTNPTNGNFAANTVVCFTQNQTFDANFADNLKICVAPNVTLTINNFNSNGSGKLTFELQGKLILNAGGNFNQQVTVNIKNGGEIQTKNSVNFNGTSNTIINYGIINANDWSFGNSSSTNILDNYSTYNINNITSGGTADTSIRNFGTLNQTGAYNGGSKTKFLNCGTWSAKSGNLASGSLILNTKDLTFSDTFGLNDGSTLSNYGTLALNNGGNLNGIFYNEGLVKLKKNHSWSNTSKIQGPQSASKKGYFEIGQQLSNLNNATFGPNLDFKRTTGSSSESTVFNGNKTLLSGISYDCRSAGNCAAPLVTDIGICPDNQGTLPPVARDDNFNLMANATSVASVLDNDLEIFNGGPATTGNVTLSLISSDNSNISLNLADGKINAGNVLPGIYNLKYQICSKSSPTNCSSATAIIKVIKDSDGDGISDDNDLDNDNDGILDVDELVNCTPVFSSTSATLNLTGGSTGTLVLTGEKGFQLDLTDLDNSFSIKINGVQLAINGGNQYPNDFNFQDPRNVIFNDDTSYGAGGIPQIYSITNTNLATPLIRFIYNANDNTLMMYGSKTQNGPLFLLKRTGTLTLNNVTWNKTGTNVIEIGQVVEGPTNLKGKIYGINLVKPCSEKDTDGDGIPDYLDLDSDGDGCPDAGEGGQIIATSSLVPAGGTLASQTPNVNITTTAVDANGVPTLVSGGQGIGSSQNNLVDACFCYNDPKTTGTALPTTQGITLLKRAGVDNGNWPMIRTGAFTVLESNTKGFVITRMTTGQINALTAQEGMMVYDTDAKCLKLYDGSAWSCFSKPACP